MGWQVLLLKGRNFRSSVGFARPAFGDEAAKWYAVWMANKTRSSS